MFLASSEEMDDNTRVENMQFSTSQWNTPSSSWQMEYIEYIFG